MGLIGAFFTPRQSQQQANLCYWQRIARWRPVRQAASTSVRCVIDSGDAAFVGRAANPQPVAAPLPNPRNPTHEKSNANKI
jgi:hypothetical protein